MVQIGVEGLDYYCRDRHDRILNSWQNSVEQYVGRASECVCVVFAIVFLHSCVCIRMFVFVCMYLHVCLCVCVFAFALEQRSIGNLWHSCHASSPSFCHVEPSSVQKQATMWV